MTPSFGNHFKPAEVSGNKRAVAACRPALEKWAAAAHLHFAAGAGTWPVWTQQTAPSCPLQAAGGLTLGLAVLVMKSQQSCQAAVCWGVLS